METLGKIRARGDSDFTVSDFDTMPYLLAFGKVRPKPLYERGLISHFTQETLRLYPTIIEIMRVTKKDDVLPLSKPIVGVSGRVYKELPVPKGSQIFISTTGYNLYVCL